MAVISQATPATCTSAPKQPMHKQTMPSTDPETFVKNTIAENDIVVFSKSYCPFCRKTKKAFEEILDSRADNSKVSQTIIELDQLGEKGRNIQEALHRMTGQRTVPNVFVAGQHVGGNDMVQVWAGQGKIDELLNSLD